MSRNPKSPAPAAPATLPASIRERSIVLVGLMGSGKSTIGRRLAQRLGPEVTAKLQSFRQLLNKYGFDSAEFEGNAQSDAQP